MRTMPVRNFPGYEVGDDGSVWSCWEKVHLGIGLGTSRRMGDTWKRLKGCPDKDGYLHITLCRDRQHYRRSVSHLVLQTFVGPCPAGFECRHLDNDRSNNSVANICWDTHAANIADKKRHGTHQTGEKHAMAKLTEEDVLEIRRLAASGVTVRIIRKQFGLSRSYVWVILRRKTWKHI